jgi:hypothetical protein
MALDFHRLDNNEYLFGLDDNKYNLLDDIFQTYKSWTGISIDQYSDTKLSIENQKTLIKFVDDYISKTNLNEDKLKTVTVIEFKSLLTYFSNSEVDLKIIGD